MHGPDPFLHLVANFTSELLLEVVWLVPWLWKTTFLLVIVFIHMPLQALAWWFFFYWEVLQTSLTINIMSLIPWHVQWHFASHGILPLLPMRPHHCIWSAYQVHGWWQLILVQVRFPCGDLIMWDAVVKISLKVCHLFKIAMPNRRQNPVLNLQVVFATSTIVLFLSMAVISSPFFCLDQEYHHIIWFNCTCCQVWHEPWTWAWCSCIRHKPHMCRTSTVLTIVANISSSQVDADAYISLMQIQLPSSLIIQPMPMFVPKKTCLTVKSGYLLDPHKL